MIIIIHAIYICTTLTTNIIYTRTCARAVKENKIYLVSMLYTLSSVSVCARACVSLWPLSARYTYNIICFAHIKKKNIDLAKTPFGRDGITIPYSIYIILCMYDIRIYVWYTHVYAVRTKSVYSRTLYTYARCTSTCTSYIYIYMHNTRTFSESVVVCFEFPFYVLQISIIAYTALVVRFTVRIDVYTHCTQLGVCHI